MRCAAQEQLTQHRFSVPPILAAKRKALPAWLLQCSATDLPGTPVNSLMHLQSQIGTFCLFCGVSCLEQLDACEITLARRKIRGQHFALFTTSFRFVLDGFAVNTNRPKCSTCNLTQDETRIIASCTKSLSA